MQHHCNTKVFKRGVVVIFYCINAQVNQNKKQWTKKGKLARQHSLKTCRRNETLIKFINSSVIIIFLFTKLPLHN